MLDVRRDPFGGPYDAIVACAVLHHLERAELHRVLVRCRAGVRDGGLLAFSTKEGDGERWSHHKLGLPRYFTLLARGAVE